MILSSFKRCLLHSLSFVLLFASIQLSAQIQEVPLADKIHYSSTVIEAHVSDSYGFWNEDHSNIYTAYRLELSKSFKGSLNDVMEVVVPGGTVGLQMEEVSHTLQLEVGETMLLMLRDLVTYGVSGSGIPRYESTAGPQSVIRYKEQSSSIRGMYRSFNSIADLYSEVEALVGSRYTEISDYDFEASSQHIQRMALTSFTPSSAAAGEENLVTITGTAFGATQGNVYFSNADDGGATFVAALATDIQSWSDTEVTCYVPESAGTGPIAVETNGGGSFFQSATDLTVPYALINVISDAVSSGTFVAYPSRHVDDNGSGGYTWQMFTDFDADADANAAFVRSLDTWRCRSGVSWTIGSVTATDVVANDGINIVRFDNGTELPMGVLGRCTSRFSGCFVGGGTSVDWYVAELDIAFDDGTSWHYDRTETPFADYDFESVSVHELGHGYQQGHVIDGADVMHYAIANGSYMREPSANNLAGTGAIQTLSTGGAVCSETAAGNHVCPSSSVVINEVDADQVGSPDAQEFVELHGPASTSLDGMALILFNGNGDVSYDAIDLTGETLDANGFFVIGSATTPNVDLVGWTTNALQQGADAVALYHGDAGEWPTGSVITETLLIDALVYDSDDADDAGLLLLMNSGQAQINEDENNNKTTESMSRVPDGGTARNSSTYTMQAPSPGASNVASCSIDAIVDAGNQTACNPGTDTYSNDVTVTYTDAPGSGTLDVNGQSFAITTSPQTVTLTGLPADANAVDITAAFSADAGCTLTTNSVFTAPSSCAPVCSVDVIADGGNQSVCDPGTDTYSNDVIVTYSNAPASGTLDVNGQSFAIGTSPQTVTLTGLVADGNAVNITAAFSADAGCTLTTNSVFTAPISCFDPCGAGYTSLVFDDFEGGTDANSVDPTTYDVSNDVWALKSSLGPITAAHEGTDFWGMRDLNNGNGGGSQDHELTYDLSFAANAYSEISVSFFFYSDMNASGDDIGYKYSVDGGAQTDVELNNNTGAWTEATFTIPLTPTATAAQVILYAGFDGGSDYGGFDRLNVCGLDVVPSTCSVDAIADGGNQTACDPGTDTYSNDVTVTYTDAPATGTLDVNGQSFAIGTSPQTVTLSGLTADGNTVNVTATFSDDAGCTLTTNSVFTAPMSCAPVCSVDAIVDGGNQSACDPGTDTYSNDVTVTYTDAPGTGTLDVNGQSFAIGTSPQTVTLTGLAADGNAVNVTAAFSADAGCTLTTNSVFTAPVSCFSSPLVINEVDYDQDGTDSEEFIEIYNSSGSGVDMTGYTIELINGSSTSVYKTITLPSITLAAGDYHVICIGSNASAYCDQSETGSIQNGAPDAVALLHSSTIVDVLSYEGDVTGYVEGTGVVSGDIDNDNRSLSRTPNGTDTDDNDSDFQLTCISPGAANTVCPEEDDCPYAMTLTPALFGVSGWDTVSTVGATESLPGCTGDADDDTWYSFIAESSNDYLLAQSANGSFDAVIELMDGCSGTTISCFNNYGNGAVERAIPGGLIPGNEYHFRVYDAASGTPATTDLRVQVKTFAQEGIRDIYCDVLDFELDDVITPKRQDLNQLYPFSSVYVNGYGVRLIDTSVPDTSIQQQVGIPSWYFALNTFDNADLNTLYDASARHRISLHANGAKTPFWSDWGPDCQIGIGGVAQTRVREQFCDNVVDYDFEDQLLAEYVPFADAYRFTFYDGLNTYVEQNPSYGVFLYEVDGLEFSETYAVTVQARVNGEWSVSGDSCDIFLQTQPSATELQLAYCNGSYSINNGNFILANPIYGASQYEWRFSPVGGGTVLSEQTSGLSFAFHITDLEFEQGIDYDVQVRAFAGGVWGDFASSCPITIEGASVQDDVDELALAKLLELTEPEMRLYPNPSQDGLFYIQLDDMSSMNAATISIWDMLGKEIHHFNSRVEEKQERILVSPLFEMEPGVYTVRLRVGEKEYSQKLIVY